MPRPVGSVTDAGCSNPTARGGQYSLVNSPPGATQTLTVLEDGRAESAKLPAGLYEIQVSGPGYQTLRIPSVRIADDKTTSLQLDPNCAAANHRRSAGSGNGHRRRPAKLRGYEPGGSRSDQQCNGQRRRCIAGPRWPARRFSDGEFSSFNVRGAGPRDNLILVDGIPSIRWCILVSFGEPDEVEGGGRYSVFAPNVIGSAEFQPGGWNSAYGGKAGSLLKLEVAEGIRDTAAYSARLDLAG